MRPADAKARSEGLRWWRSRPLPEVGGRAIGRAESAMRAAGRQVHARLRATWPGHSPARGVTLGLLVALAYYAGARLGFLLVFPGSPLSVLWPPNAIVLAALLLVPPRTWWVVLLGVLPAHLVVEWQSGVPPWAVPGLYVTNCGEALLGASFVLRLAGGRPPWLGTLRQVVVYVGGAALAAPFVASFLDTGVVVLTQWAAPREYWLLWEERFISAVLTNLTVAPVILIGAVGGWRRWRTTPRRRGIEAVLLALGIAGSGFLAFNTPTALAQGTPQLLYLLVPVLLWAAARFGVGGIGASLLAVALLAAAWTDAVGLFVARSPGAAVVTLQLFLIAIGAPALCLAALVRERERDAAALRASEARYRAVVETQTEMINRFRPDLTITFVNDATCRFIGKSREEILGTSIVATMNDSAAARVRESVQALLTHPDLDALTVEHEDRYHDGSLHWQQWVNRAIRDADGRVVELQGIGRDITERKRAEQERERLTQRLLTVQDEERRRLARELHDGTAQTIAALNLNLASLRAQARGGVRGRTGFERLLADSQALPEQATRETRTLSYLLHPPQLDDAGLVPALGWYVKGFSQRSGIRVDLQAPVGAGRLPTEPERALFRIVQECLTNVYRYSGSATARVVLTRRARSVRLLVIDRGGGMAAAPTNGHEDPDDVMTLGVGIPGMRERLYQLGGRLWIRSTSRGTIVLATVPVVAPSLASL